jgi:hypothetical protein
VRSYSQQQELYGAIYCEASAVNRLLEEAECALAPADVAVLAYETRRFLTDGAWSHQGDVPPAEVLAAEINSDDDAGACSVAIACNWCALALLLTRCALQWRTSSAT